MFIHKRLFIRMVTIVLAASTIVPSYAQHSAGRRRAAALPAQSKSEPVMVEVKNPAGSTISLTYTLPQSGITTTAESYNSTALFSVNVGNALQSGNEGEPVLPVIPVHVVLPPGHTVTNVTVHTTGKKELPGTFRIRHGEAKVPLIPGKAVRKALPLEGIYSSNNHYPANMVELVGVQYKRGVAIAVLKVNPVSYRPRSGKITTFESITFELQTKKRRV